MKQLRVMDPAQYVIRVWCAACMGYTRRYDQTVCDYGHKRGAS